MEINLLNPAQLATALESGAPGTTDAVDGDAFARMMAQIGVAPEAAPALPVADAAAAEGAAESLVAGMLRAASALPKDESLAPAAPEAGAAEAASDEEPSVAPADLPPILAALIAPALQPAAQAGPTSPPTAVVSSAAAAIPTTTAVALQPDAITPNATTAEVRGAPADVPAEPIAAMAPQSDLSQLARLSMPTGAVVHGGKGATKASTPTGAEPMPLVKAEAYVKPAAEALPFIAPTPAAPFEAVTDSASVEAPAPAEPIIEQQLDLAREGEWLDRLAKDIARTAAGEGHLRFRLNPENLGSLHVELTQGSSGASVRLTADTEAARTILVDAQPRLVAEARAQGVKIAETHVDLGSQSQSSAGGGQRDGRDLPQREYFTTWKPRPGEETSKSPQRSSSERYA